MDIKRRIENLEGRRARRLRAAAADVTLLSDAELEMIIAEVAALGRIQSKAQGVPDWVIDVVEMSEDELIRERDRLLAAIAAGSNTTAGD